MNIINLILTRYASRFTNDVFLLLFFLTALSARAGDLTVDNISVQQEASFYGAMHAYVPGGDVSMGPFTNQYGGAGTNSAGPMPGASPIGAIHMYAATNAPSGWLLCDGSQVSSNQYPDLFAVIGYTYGGSGGNFNLPDLRGRVVVGTGSGTGLTVRALGNLGGAESHAHGAGSFSIANHTHTGPSHYHSGPSHTHSVPSHTLTSTEMPAHSHNFTYGGNPYSSWKYAGGHGGSINFFLGDNGGNPVGISTEGSGGGHVHPDVTAGGTGNTGYEGTGNTGSASLSISGSASSTNSMPPYLVVNFIIHAGQ